METTDINPAEAVRPSRQKLEKVSRFKFKQSELQVLFPVLIVFFRGISQILGSLGAIGAHVQNFFYH